MPAEMLTAKVKANVLFLAPGRHRLNQMSQFAYEMLTLGREVRDQHLWEYPILPGAFNVFKQMVASREWKISGHERSVSRAVDLINSTVTRNYDGTSEYGFEQFLLRQSMDWGCLGRTAFHWEKGKDIQYIDPAYLMPFFDPDRNMNLWDYSISDQRFPASEIVMGHPNPIGAMGHFVAPIFPVLPTAMMSWLVREHNMASADGRKVRDIFIVYSEELAGQMKSAIESAAAVWSGANPSENGVSIVFVENPGEGMKASDYVARIGIANIPDQFDEREFNFLYANEIGNNLGMTLRQFWNIETGTNRALEDVQEHRQVSKGPAYFVRSVQRNLNACGVITQFGNRTRMGFIEEVDSASRETNAKVLKAYSEALKAFAEVFGGTVNGDAFLAWLQSEGILPPDIDLISDIGVMQTQDQGVTPQAEDEIIQESDPNPSPAQSEKAAEKIVLLREAINKKQDESKHAQDVLDYDEISVDLNGRVIERRKKVFSLQRAVEVHLDKTGFFDRKLASASTPTWNSAISQVYENNLKKFRDLKGLNDQDEKLKENILSEKILTVDHHKAVRGLLKKYDGIRNLPEADAVADGV